jgi:DNA-binding HxlR family transcriptional regulator
MARLKIAPLPPSPHAAAVDRTLEVIGGKWTVLIVRELLGGERRFGQVMAAIGSISPRVLAMRLRELERCGLVTRTIYPEVPPRVEYALTEEGRTLRPIVAAMAAWGAAHETTG